MILCAFPHIRKWALVKNPINFDDFVREHKARMTRDERQQFDRDKSVFQIASLIYAGRRSAGITQAELAEMAGVEQADISRYEHGSQTPSMVTLFRIIESLNGSLTISFQDRRKFTVV